MNRKSLGAAIIAALLASSIAAFAGNTTFFTSIGDLAFPFTAPSNAGATPGSIDNMTIGATTPRAGTFSNVTNTNPTPIKQGSAVAHNSAATLAVADLSAGIITSAPSAGIALTLPLATAMDTAFPNSVATSSIDFSVINTSSTAANIDTMTIATGWTLVGNMVITPLTTGGTSARFRATKTAAGAWTLFRIS